MPTRRDAIFRRAVTPGRDWLIALVAETAFGFIAWFSMIAF
jgi:hypothetical protein